MPVMVPVTSEKTHFKVQLGLWLLDFTVYFNERSQLWMFDLRDASNDTPLLYGAPFVLGQDLLEPYVFGIGSVICYDTTEQHQDAGADDLGNRVIVPYFTPDEAAAV